MSPFKNRFLHARALEAHLVLGKKKWKADTKRDRHFWTSTQKKKINTPDKAKPANEALALHGDDKKA